MSFHDQRQMALSLSLRRINKTIVQLKKSQKYNNSISYDYTNVTSTLFTVSEIYSNFLNSKYCFCIGPEECSHKYGTEIFNNVFFIIQPIRQLLAIHRCRYSTISTIDFCSLHFLFLVDIYHFDCFYLHCQSSGFSDSDDSQKAGK